VTKLRLGHAALEAPASLPVAVAAKRELGGMRSQAGAWERGGKKILQIGGSISFN